MHDAAGNLEVIDRPGTATDTTLTPDAENRLESAVTGGETTEYGYDLLGRRTGESSPEGAVTYTWNSLGQLARVASTDATSTYEYGPSGMREYVVVESAEGTTTTTSAWVGSRLALERDSDGTLYRYLWGPDGLPLELVVDAPEADPVSYAYQCDRAGSVIALTDSVGTVVASYAYDPWGEVLSTGGSDPALTERNPLRYRAYYFDTATGHYYLPARYYDPEVARFLSADPASPSAGDPLSLNRYGYCVGDPVNASDATGETIDVDDDGRLDSEDSASESYIRTPSSSPLKAKRRARMVEASRVAQVSPAAAVSFSTVTVVGGDQVVVGPGSLVIDEYVYDQWDPRPTRPSTADNIVLTIGFGCDIGTCTIVSPYATAMGIVVDVGWTSGKTVQAANSHATIGDVMLSSVSAVPFVSTWEAFWFYPTADEEGWYAVRHERLR